MKKKAAVVYFSISGNTKKIAKAFQDSFSDEGWDSRQISVVNYNNVNDRKTIQEADVIGFGIPCHFINPPANIPPFILEQIPDISDKPVFLYCTFGITPGRSMNKLTELFHKKGAQIIGGSFFPGFDKYPLFFKSRLSYGKPNAEDIKAAKKFIHYLVFKLAHREQADFWDVTAKIIDHNFIEGILARINTNKEINRISPPIVFPDSLRECLACKKCAEICPTGDIKMNPFPSLINDCLKCYECYYACPEKAIKIEFNWRHKLFIYLLTDLELSFSLQRKEYKQPYFYL